MFTSIYHYNHFMIIIRIFRKDHSESKRDYKNIRMNSQNRENIIEICKILAQEENLKVTITESAKGALCAGMGVFIGGILAGPVGMIVGGTLTSVAVGWSAKGKFKSVVEIIDEMSDDQKRRLTENVQKAIQNVKPEDCIGLLTLIMTSGSVKGLVIAELGAFLKKELQMQMIQSG